MFRILWHSLSMAFQELKVNKLRTFLSLFGITIGIFCIIGVLATVDSLKRKVNADFNSLGSKTIWIDKWEYFVGDGHDYPWWKYVNRPVITYHGYEFVKQQSELASYVAYYNSRNANFQYRDREFSGGEVYGVSEDFIKIQKFTVQYGRYINDNEFTYSATVGVIGYEAAVNLYGSAQNAVGKWVMFNGKRISIIGVIEKQGQSFVNAFNYDQCLILCYYCYASIYNTLDGSGNMNPIIVQTKPGISNEAIKDELRSIMRRLHRLNPRQEDNFTLNDMDFLGTISANFFKTLNIGGWFIAGLSLLVGGFGVANIMFVTVRERTGQIGLKKAVGAKSRTILLEFLLESSFLCVLGGLMGLFFVWILTLVLSTVFPFPIVIAYNIIVLALSICIGLGIIFGIIPASIAARMNPVNAIRSTT
ncbi:MAG: ABC transporter permease [Chitinophagaceae bacterium]|nr:ABC transporter permease [Chitinophagaceae bacterium]